VTFAIDQLPEDLAALRGIIAEQQALIAEQQGEIAEQRNEIIVLNERVKLLQHEIFGRRSEKWNGGTEQQRLIFNEMEQYVATPPEAPAGNAGGETGRKKARRGRKAGRKPKDEALPAFLPREHRYFTLPDEEIGARRFIRWETSETLVVEK
jgi:hypothetical protein